MKQKIVLSVPMMSNPKWRSKAMKAAVSVPGVISATLEGTDQDQIVVIGEGVDSTRLTTLLKKKIGYTQLVSLTVVDENKTEETKETKPSIETVVCPTTWAYQYNWPQPLYYVCETTAGITVGSCEAVISTVEVVSDES